MATEKVSATFEERFDAYFDELKWLYCELYHNDMQSFEFFCEMLRKSYSERKQALRVIDQKRIEDPDWYRSNKLLGMMLYVKQFAGNLTGVREKLSYLEECGVN